MLRVAPEAVAAVAAASLVGTADFISRLNGRYLSPAQMTLWVSSIGALLMLAVRLTTDPAPLQWGTPWLWLAGGLNTIGLWLLYKGIQRGPVSVLAPAAAPSPVFTALMWAACGVYPTGLGVVGMVLSLCGVMWMGAAGGRSDQRSIVPTLLLGLAAAGVLSVRMFLVQRALSDLPAVDTLLIVRMAGTLCALGLVYGERDDRREPIALPRLGLRMLGQALLETSGVLLIFYASRGSFKAVAPALFSCSTLITVLWSRTFLHERLSPARVSAALLIVVGAAMLTFFSGA